MIELSAREIFRYRGYKKEYILFFWMDFDEICRSTEENMKILERENPHLTALKINWWDFKSFCDAPADIGIYSVHLFFNNWTIGIINSPNLDDLRKFCKMCGDIRSTPGWNCFGILKNNINFPSITQKIVDKANPANALAPYYINRYFSPERVLKLQLRTIFSPYNVYQFRKLDKPIDCIFKII